MHSKLTVHPPPAGLHRVPQLWYQNNPVKTHFFNALSTLFPQGENFFIWSLRQFEAQARTPLLRQQIEDFAIQERNHAAIHRAYNRCLAKDGYPIARMEAMMARRIKFGQTHLAPILCLAITMATEHITAILSEKVLQERLIPAAIEGSMRQLWIWHAMEEIDHKAVAMDLFQDAGGRYRHKLLGMLCAAPVFWGHALFRMLTLLQHDRQLGRWQTWWQIAALLFGKDGLLQLVTGDMLRYLAAGFHPAQHDNYDLLASGRRCLQALRDSGTA